MAAAQSGKSKSRLPLKEIDDKNKSARELNGEFLNLYRVLGHHPRSCFRHGSSSPTRCVATARPRARSVN